MPTANSRLVPFDLVRSFAILFVFLGHTFGQQVHNKTFLVFSWAVSPNLTMSLMGFLSGFLLTERYRGNYDGRFYLKRWIRTYVPLFLTLTAIGILRWFQGKPVANQHTLLHFMGLSVFIELLGLKNHSAIGEGLWFITAIIILYLVLPLLTLILRHPNRLYHLIGLIVLFAALDLVMSGQHSSFNVATAFTIGVYLALHQGISFFRNRSFLLYFLLSAGLIGICALAVSQTIPWATQSLLYPFYPLFFVPLFFRLSEFISGYPVLLITLFSEASYEFYIFHFYFINRSFAELFPGIQGLVPQIVISFLIIFLLSLIFAWLARRIGKFLENYFDVIPPPDRIH